MSNLAHREHNGKKGEIRTNAILSDAFWIVNRSADIDGADFLIEIPSDILNELREKQNKISVYNVMQAKYFEDTNQVKIHKEYVYDKNEIHSRFCHFEQR